MDRRAVFFLVAALVCALLVIPSDADLRWVPIALTVVYLVLAAASYLDFRSQMREPHDAAGRSRPSDDPDQPNRPVM